MKSRASRASTDRHQGYNHNIDLKAAYLVMLETRALRERRSPLQMQLIVPHIAPLPCLENRHDDPDWYQNIITCSFTTLDLSIKFHHNPFIIL